MSDPNVSGIVNNSIESTPKSYGDMPSISRENIHESMESNIPTDELESGLKSATTPSETQQSGTAQASAEGEHHTDEDTPPGAIEASRDTIVNQQSGTTESEHHSDEDTPPDAIEASRDTIVNKQSVSHADQHGEDNDPKEQPKERPGTAMEHPSTASLKRSETSGRPEAAGRVEAASERVAAAADSVASAHSRSSIDSRSHSSRSVLINEAGSKASDTVLGGDPSDRGGPLTGDVLDSSRRDEEMHELLQGLESDTVDPRDGLKVLNELFTGGKINETQYNDLKRKHKYLQSMFWACVQNRSNIREDIQEAHTLLQVLREKARQEEDNTANNDIVEDASELHTVADLEGKGVEDLRKYLISFDQQQKAFENSTYQIGYRTRHLQEEKEQLAEKINADTLSSSKIYLNSPNMLEKEIRDLNVEIRLRKQEIRNLNDDISTRSRLIPQKEGKIKKLEQKIAVMEEERDEIMPRAVLITRDADREEKHTLKLRKQTDALNAEVTLVLARLKDSNDATQKLDNERNELIKAMDKEYKLLDAKSKECANLARDAERCRERSALLMEEKNRAENRLASLASELRTETIATRDTQKAAERLSRELRGSEETLRTQREVLLARQNEAEKLSRMLQHQTRAAAELPAQRKTLQREVDAAHNDTNVLASLTVSERQNLQRMAKERGTLIRLQEQLAKQLDTLCRQHGNLIRQRDTNARVTRKLASDVEKNEDELMNRITVVAKYKKKCEETEKQTRQLGDRYELAKKERDEMSAQLNISLTNCEELQKKTEILRSQQDTMLSRKMELERQHSLTRAATMKTILEKTMTQSTINQEKECMKELERQCDQLDMMISCHQMTLNSIKEAVMTDLDEYKRQVVDRNERGLLLVERDEEACAFQEKINLQELFIEQGYTRLDSCEKDIVELEKTISTEKHHIKCLNAQQNEIQEMESGLADTRFQLHTLNERTQVATNEIESPSARQCRKLSGRPEQPDDVAHHLRRIELQLYEAELRILERQMADTQVERLVDRLRADIDASRTDSEQLAKRANDSKRSVQATSRKFMANAAEVAVAKSEARRLGEVRARLIQQLETARQRVASGMPPDPTERPSMVGPQATPRPPSPPAGPSPRPTQYLPAAEGSLPLPRPYGAFGPFKPQAAGARLRQLQRQRASRDAGASGDSD